MTDDLFRPLGTMCDLSVCALEFAANEGLPPAHMYELHVAHGLFTTGCMVARICGATVKDNPLAPYINVIEDKRLSPGSWFIQSGEVRIGSKGCL